jgi:hypothetical protein
MRPEQGSILVSTLVKVAVADLVILASVFLVIQDVDSRMTCALLACNPAVTRTSPVFYYSILTKTFALGVNGRTLTSPLTLDWVQVLGAAFVLLNLWYLYRFLGERRTRALQGAGASV